MQKQLQLYLGCHIPMTNAPRVFNNVSLCCTKSCGRLLRHLSSYTSYTARISDSVHGIEMLLLAYQPKEDIEAYKLVLYIIR